MPPNYRGALDLARVRGFLTEPLPHPRLKSEVVK
jgi:hypothetical protein